MKSDIARNRWYLFTGLIVIFGLAALAWGRLPTPGANTAALPPAPIIGHPAPAFSLQTVDGQPLALADLAGQPVILNFWATWCLPCRAEMPELQRLHERLVEAGLVVLGVNQAEQLPAVTSYRQELGIDFPSVVDPRLGVSRQYGVNSLPTTFFIDRVGVIRDIFIGPMTDAVLADKLRKIYP
jgi:cytochrome c biogenesis protein CcmG/thiol:disulfide interchange protein DsbE